MTPKESRAEYMKDYFRRRKKNHGKPLRARLERRAGCRRKYFDPTEFDRRFMVHGSSRGGGKDWEVDA